MNSLRELVRAARPGRDRVLIFLGSTLNLTSKKITSITFGEATQLAVETDDPFIQEITSWWGNRAGLQPEHLMFRSQLTWSKLTRTAVWKVVSKASAKMDGTPGGVDLLHNLAYDRDITIDDVVNP